MRHLLLVPIGVSALLLTACDAPEVTTDPDPVDEVGNSSPETDEEEIRAQVGDSITLRGFDEDLQLRVTVTEIFDPAEPGEFLAPDRGNRYVAIDLELTNVGEATYDDSPGNGAIVIDDDNRQHVETFGDVRDCRGFQGSVTMASGDARAGCVVFEVPEEAGLRNFQFALDSGFAPQKGIWDLA